MASKRRKSPQAEIDVTEIWQYIAEDSVRAADAIIDRIDAAFDMLADSPLVGRARQDLARNLRSFAVGNYVIFYVPVRDGIEVVRVMHGRRDISADDMQ
ncbi:type II toxin-antitoxin system RelE/ParE family toxin [Bradyrhizobium jicamae]|uniref:type II toxin-antitoxin system RelE/ParE family toxin n=1 Tax=Bradyrhizobium jicamae TaxID=280332 RepID=UPI001BA5F2F0|nr:type II toxin-antitoxin system RelE/ParE family toxin [Bradyrhizobium jicamae]MBR0755108.1 type II toxin-antitoxin system RelE/ParE family toxin [Bradyrhizobium jicamae]